MNNKACLYVILFTTFLDWMSIGLVYPMFTTMVFAAEGVLLAEGAGDTARALVLGLLLSATSITEFFVAPVLGALSDRRGRRKVLLVSLFCGVVGYGLCVLSVFVASIWLLIVARLVVGVASSNAGVAAATIADISTTEDRARHFTLYSMMCGVGFAVGPFFGGMLSQWGYSVPFLFTLVLTVLNMIFVFWVLPETNPVGGIHSSDEAFGFANIKKALFYPRLRAVFISSFFVIVGWSLYWEFMPVHQIRYHGFSSQQVGNMFAYGGAFFVFSSAFLTRYVIARFGEMKSFEYAMLHLALAISAVYFFSEALLLWWIIPLQQFWLALFYPTSTTLVSRMAAPSAQGEVLGIHTSIQSFAFVVAPILGGLMLSVDSHILVIAAVAMVLIGALFFRREVRRSETQDPVP